MSQTPEGTPYNNGQEGSSFSHDPLQPVMDRLGIKREEANKSILGRQGLAYIRGISYVLIENRSMDEPNLSDDEMWKAEYYIFSLAAATMGVNVLANPHLSEEQRDLDAFGYSEGAWFVAQDYLQDDPDNPIAKMIMQEGTDAPLAVHQRFFNLIGPAINRFIQRYCL